MCGARSRGRFVRSAGAESKGAQGRVQNVLQRLAGARHQRHAPRALASVERARTAAAARAPARQHVGSSGLWGHCRRRRWGAAAPRVPVRRCKGGRRRRRLGRRRLQSGEREDERRRRHGGGLVFGRAIAQEEKELVEGDVPVHVAQLREGPEHRFRDAETHSPTASWPQQRLGPERRRGGLLLLGDGGEHGLADGRTQQPGARVPHGGDSAARLPCAVVAAAAVNAPVGGVPLAQHGRQEGATPSHAAQPLGAH